MAAKTFVISGASSFDNNMVLKELNLKIIRFIYLARTIKIIGRNYLNERNIELRIRNYGIHLSNVSNHTPLKIGRQGGKDIIPHPLNIVA
jgi:hypothetical protein